MKTALRTLNFKEMDLYKYDPSRSTKFLIEKFNKESKMEKRKKSKRVTTRLDVTEKDK